MARDDYDYIIVGAGSAGCTLAYRLGADPSVKVLVLEAGKPDTNFFIHMPAGVVQLAGKGLFNWGYWTEPQVHCKGRKMYWPRGKTLGGSSSINAMLYIRGNAWDYDHWRQLGNAGWSYGDVLPYFLRAQHNERGASEFHGVGGPLNVADQVSPAKINAAFVEACVQAGHKRSTDFNGASQDGVGYYQVTQKGGKRWSAAQAYLRPAMARGNVTVVTEAHTARVVVENGRATSVAYRKDGKDEIARATREVALSGGAINSPQLLMLSGIGPADHLKTLGINVVADVPGVGGNLQDHLDAATLYYCKTRDTYDTANQLVTLAKYVFGKTGPGTSCIAETGGFLRTADGLSAPDIQLHFIPAFVIDHGRTQMKQNGMTLHVCLLRPESTGTIRLKSADPMADPAIDANYLAASKDLDGLVKGTRLAREIFAQTAFEPYRGDELEPGVGKTSDADIADWVRARSETIYHPVGSCKMGPESDAMAVVDSQLRVRGVEGLRVVDASIMPTLIGGNTNAPTIMIAERAADFMLGKAALTQQAA
ncbi:MAG: choline dehydrogenase [Alphaproteobacteria bacterium]|nr:choline dehydrogenase [Alphaproteobacteria bacterium]